MIAIDGIPCRPMDLGREVYFTDCDGTICKGILACIGYNGAGIKCEDGRKFLKDFDEVHYINPDRLPVGSPPQNS